MKKILILLMVLMVVGIKEVGAASFTVSCDAFEVANIENDGSFKKVSCYNNFSDAKNHMKQHENYVVRHRKSQSPMKIVAMNHGVAYTNDTKHSTNKPNVIYLNGTGVTSYINAYQDVFYLDTISFNAADGTGKIKAIIADFEGSIALENVDLVPTIFFERGLKINLYGSYSFDGSVSGSRTYTANRSYYTIEKNGNYHDLVFHLYLGSGNNGYEYHIGPAPKFMKTGVKYYSYNAYDFYSDMNCTEKLVRNIIIINFYHFVLKVIFQLQLIILF